MPSAPVPAWLTRWRAVAVSVGVLGLVVWGLVADPTVPTGASETGTGPRDIELYAEIAQRVADGGSYYPVAVSLQREWGFPTLPAASVREPLSAWIIAGLGPTGARILLGALLLVALVAMMVRLQRVTASRVEWFASILLLAATASAFLVPDAVYLQESWACAFILLSLAVRTGRHWGFAIVAAVIAVMFRETALVYPAVMAVVAIAQRRRAEVMGWAAAGVAWVGFYAWHLGQVTAVQVPDPVSAPSWASLGGWPFVVGSVRFSSALALVPYWLCALVVPVALAGWLFARGQAGLRIGLTALAFSVTFLVVGRTINLHWGLLFAGALLPGLALAPRGIVAIVGALRGGPGRTRPGR